MVGGGSRRDDGPVGIRSGNVFAALETLKKKKKSEKSSKGSSKAKEPEPPQVFWAPTPLASKSWADVDDEDDDDYYATTAPPQNLWGVNQESQQQGTEVSAPLEEESESEEEVIDDGDDEIEEEPEHEPEVPVQFESAVKKPSLASLAPKDTERQLSKKELKKKELAELDAVLAELGISGKDNQNSGQGVTEGKKSEDHDVYDEKSGNAPAPLESKTSKKKKVKKEKSLKEVKDSQEQPNGSAVEGPDGGTGMEPAEKDTSSIDVKERLKKVALMKKKKSSKEMDAAARAAAIEAAARSAKLAAAKKKEKNHYNQQPVR